MVFPEAISSNTERKKKARFQKDYTEVNGQQLGLDQANPVARSEQLGYL
jgi:hypothetical protein